MAYLDVNNTMVGMCGVGKWMKCWKEWESDACPRCGEAEDAEHILLCQGKDANFVWDNALQNLQHWLDDQQTDLDISSSILTGLHNWRYSENKPLSCLSSMSLML
jgi:hypothetical protein